MVIVLADPKLLLTAENLETKEFKLWYNKHKWKALHLLRIEVGRGAYSISNL